MNKNKIIIVGGVAFAVIGLYAVNRAANGIDTVFAPIGKIFSGLESFFTGIFSGLGSSEVTPLQPVPGNSPGASFINQSFGNGSQNYDPNSLDGVNALDNPANTGSYFQ